MLRIRSRTVTSKQNKVGDHSNNHHHQPWFLHEKSTKNSSSFFNYSTFFSNKVDPHTMMNPISILDKNPFSAVSSFRVFDSKPENISRNKVRNTQHYQHVWEQICSKQGIGLALIDENTSSNKQQNGKHVVFGSQLRVKAQNSSVFYCFYPEFPAEFGIKTPRNKTQVKFGEVNPKNGSISGINGILMSEIDEQSEDYTCVISHGPNPKTTHIFGNCIVDNSYCGKFVESPKKSGKFSSFGNLRSSKDDFLSSCHHCKKQLGEGKDIYMYRGEKAFCSEECRCEEVFFDEEENYN